MIDGKFDVVFRGQIVKNAELSEVKDSLVKLFKSSPGAVENLFSGEEVAIKKSLDYSTAMKYQSAIKKAGALALIKEVESENTNTRQAAKTEAPQYSTPAIPQASNNAQTEATDVSESTNGLTLAEAGAQIMPDKIYAKHDVDTSALSLAAAGERIMPEREPEVVEQPSIEHLSLEDK